MKFLRYVARNLISIRPWSLPLIKLRLIPQKKKNFTEERKKVKDKQNINRNRAYRLFPFNTVSTFATITNDDSKNVHL